MNNLEIRQAIAKNRLRYFEVAEACGVTASTFSTWLRKEFTPEKKIDVLKAIETLVHEYEDGNRG